MSRPPKDLLRYLDKLQLCDSTGTEAGLSTNMHTENFRNASQCLWNAAVILAVSAYFPRADAYLHLFAFPVCSHHCFKGSCASQATACLLCSLCPHATSSECRGRGLPAATSPVARWAWGAKAGTWALPRGDGLHHDRELNSHGNSSLISRLCDIIVFSLFLLTSFTGELPPSCVF